MQPKSMCLVLGDLKVQMHAIIIRFASAVRPHALLGHLPSGARPAAGVVRSTPAAAAAAAAMAAEAAAGEAWVLMGSMPRADELDGNSNAARRVVRSPSGTSSSNLTPAPGALLTCALSRTA